MLPSSSLHPEDGGSNVHQNVSTLPQHYTASSPKDSDLKNILLKI